METLSTILTCIAQEMYQTFFWLIIYCYWWSVNWTIWGHDLYRSERNWWQCILKGITHLVVNMVNLTPLVSPGHPERVLKIWTWSELSMLSYRHVNYHHDHLPVSCMARKSCLCSWKQSTSSTPTPTWRHCRHFDWTREAVLMTWTVTKDNAHVLPPPYTAEV